jgi:Asp-tRNA(Asn)/Glu-tRNA(Gln) amidotransferase B subunit
MNKLHKIAGKERWALRKKLVRLKDQKRKFWFYDDILDAYGGSNFEAGAAYGGLCREIREIEEMLKERI